jgi:hypothetical protein
MTNRHHLTDDARRSSRAPHRRQALLFIFPRAEAGRSRWNVRLPGRPRRYRTFDTLADAVGFAESLMAASRPDLRLFGLAAMFTPRDGWRTRA